jgi:Xaa-Pro dipeptidase
MTGDAINLLRDPQADWPEDKAQHLFDQAKASRLMAESGIDAIIAHTRANASYITDYYSDLGWPDFLLEDGKSYYATFVGVPRDSAQAPFMIGCSAEQGDVAWEDPWIKDRRFWGPDFIVTGKSGRAQLKSNPVDAVAAALADRGLEQGRIGLEMRHIKQIDFLRFVELLPYAAFVDAEPLLWRMRMIKSAAEVARMRVASQATSKAVEAAFRAARPGMTEIEMDRIIARTILDTGCRHEWTEIAFGPKGAYMVGPTLTRLEEGQIMRLDVGASYRGYLSDISRVAAFGKVGEKAERAHQAILSANEALRQVVRPGIPGRRLHKVLIDAFAGAGLAPLTPMAGHGVGRTSHEPPFSTADDETVLLPGMTITVEPAIRLAQVGSINVEDTVVVTGNGMESLTTAPRGLYDYA